MKLAIQINVVPILFGAFRPLQLNKNEQKHSRGTVTETCASIFSFHRNFKQLLQLYAFHENQSVASSSKISKETISYAQSSNFTVEMELHTPSASTAPSSM